MLTLQQHRPHKLQDDIELLLLPTLLLLQKLHVPSLRESEISMRLEKDSNQMRSQLAHILAHHAQR